MWEYLEENGIEAGTVRLVRQILSDILPETVFTEIFLLKGGMTNRTFVLRCENASYLLRLPGAGSEYIVNRVHEKAVYDSLRGNDITEEVLYINAENGIKISGFLEDYHVCDSRNRAEVGRCIRKMKAFHALQLRVPHTFDVFEEIGKYEQKAGDFSDRFADCRETRANVLSLKNLIEADKREACLCHIDANQDNFLLNADDVRLIDWEYAGMSDPYIDVAMFGIYAGYEKDDADWLIAEYLGAEDGPHTRMQVYAYMSAGAYLWVLWCEIKRASGTDFQEYEAVQYRLAKSFYQYAIELRGDVRHC